MEFGCLNSIAKDLSAFSLILHVWVHLWISLREAWISCEAASDVLCELQMAVSSAKSLVLVMVGSVTGKSWQYTEYNRGERTEPWGTPERSCTGLEKVLLTFILQDRFVRNESIIRTRAGLRFR